MSRKTKAIIKGTLLFLGIVALCLVVWKRSSRFGSTREGLGNSFEFDFEKYLDVDPALIMYDEVDPITPGIGDPMALDEASGKIFVAGSGNIVTLDSKGKELSRFKVAGEVISVAVDPEKGIYAGVGNHVEVFDFEGQRIASWEATSENALPVSIAFRGADVFVGEARKGEVHRYDRDGVLLDSITGFVLFSSPKLGIAVGADGTLFAANPGKREIRRYKRNGNPAGSWSKPGRDIDSFSGCCNPVDIAIRPDGNIVTSEKDIVRIKVVSPDGELQGVVAGPRKFDPSIKNLDIDVDDMGRVLVLDPVQQKVRVFAPRKEPAK